MQLVLLMLVMIFIVMEMPSINGTLRVSVLTSDGDVNCDGCNADTFNSHIITNDIVFKHNDVEYMRFNATNDTIDLSKELNLGSSTLKINSITV